MSLHWEELAIIVDRAPEAQFIQSVYGAMKDLLRPFLANVRYMSSSVRLSSVCNVRAPYSDCCNFRQCFYAIW